MIDLRRSVSLHQATPLDNTHPRQPRIQVRAGTRLFVIRCWWASGTTVRRLEPAAGRSSKERFQRRCPSRSRYSSVVSSPLAYRSSRISRARLVLVPSRERLTAQTAAAMIATQLSIISVPHSHIQPPPHPSMWPHLPSLSPARWARSEEHTSELQSLMRISYAVFCL